MEIIYCGNCGKQNSDGNCQDCHKKTLIVANEPIRFGYEIPQIPLSFDDSQQNYGMMMFKSNHVMHMLNFDSGTPFGNLELIFMNILKDIEYLNSRIKDAFESYAIAQYYEGEKILGHLRSIEESVYWMRRIIDRLISIHWLLFNKRKNKSYPTKIEIDCIGSLLKSNNLELRTKYSKEILEFFDFLNEVSNAYKHSILNGENTSIRVGKEEPLVIALGLAYNNTSRDLKYMHDSLFNVVIKFISYYKEMREKISKEID